MKLDDNSTIFKLPKPIYYSIEKDVIEDERKKTILPQSNRKQRVESRPRNVTDYEKGHKDVCKNSWQEDYTKLHQHLIESNQNKFIFYKCPPSGWGNRLRDLLISFHFAVVAKRAFIIDCDVPSSPLDRFLPPRNIKWNYKVNETRLTVKRGRRVILNDIKDPGVFEKMLNYSVEYSPGLIGNKYQFLADHVKYDLPVWPNLVQMVGCSFYYLFKKSDMLQEHLDKWKEKMGFNQNIVLGIHFRHGDSVFHTNRNRGDSRISMKDVDFSFDCVKQVQEKVEEKYNTTKVIWFLAADSQKTKDYAKQKFGDKVRLIEGPIEHLGHPTRGNEDAGQLSMFVDYFLLQESDYRLYTGPSTFDGAIDYITLGRKDAGSTFYKKMRLCVMPASLKS
jgi:hypothetical protein